MRVFVTGATGYVGQAVVQDLLAAGHQVLGLARNDAGARRLEELGAEVRRGDLTDTEGLAAAAREADGVAHLAFIHDFSKMAENIEIDRRAAEAMLAALEGSGKPFVLTSGVSLLRPGQVATEDDLPRDDGGFSRRGQTELVVLGAAKTGVRAMVVRLPQVHGAGDHGFTAQLVDAARRSGFAGYLGDGANRWPAVARADAARVYRLALERGEAGSIFHAIAEDGVAARDLAEAIAEGLGVPARSLTPDEAAQAFGWFAPLATMDSPAASEITRQALGWTPEGPTLLHDLRNTDYFTKAARTPA